MIRRCALGESGSKIRWIFEIATSSSFFLDLGLSSDNAFSPLKFLPGCAPGGRLVTPSHGRSAWLATYPSKRISEGKERSQAEARVLRRPRYWLPLFPGCSPLSLGPFLYGAQVVPWREK